MTASLQVGGWENWAEAANWAAAHGYGIGSISRRGEIPKIDAMLAILGEWEQHPERFSIPEPESRPEQAQQCPLCGIWFVDLPAHDRAHRQLIPPRQPERRTAQLEAVTAPTGTEEVGSPAPAESGQLAELMFHLQWAMAEHESTSAIADRLRSTNVHVGVLVDRLWSDPSRAQVLTRGLESRPGVLADDGRRMQCHLCGLWFVKLGRHIVRHGVTAAQYRVDHRLPVGQSLVAGRESRGSRSGVGIVTAPAPLLPSDRRLLDVVTAAGRVTDLPRVLAEQLERARELDRQGLDRELFHRLDEIAPQWRTDRYSDDDQELRPEPQATIETSLAAAGFADWGSAVVWAAREHQDPEGVAAHLAAPDVDDVRDHLAAVWETDAVRTAVVPHMMSRRGRIHDDGRRVQCHVCGLWFRSVGLHARIHGLGAKQYRAAFAIPARQSLASIGARDVGRAGVVGEVEAPSDFHRWINDGDLGGWLEGLQWAAAGHHSLKELARHLRTGNDRTREVVSRIIRREGYLDALGGDLRSVPGHLEDDGSRVQCHLCGLWSVGLGTHLPLHGIDSATYRERAGLAASVPITSAGRFTARTPAQIEAEWRPELQASLGCDSMTAAAAWAADRGLGARGLAQELGCTYSKLSEDFAAAGVRFLTRSEQWRVRAERRKSPLDVLSDRQREFIEEFTAHREAGGTSADIPGGSLRAALARWRQREREGKELPVFAFLDQLDPGWRTADEDARVSGGESFKVARVRARWNQVWRDRWAAAGWDGWHAAVRWAAAEHAGFDEIAERLDCSELTVGSAIRDWWRANPENLSVTADLQTAPPGKITDDGYRMQCHVCGLWFLKVGTHANVHGLSAAEYRRRFNLGARRLASKSTNLKGVYQGVEDVLEPMLAERGLDKPDQLLGLAEDMRGLARELGVSRSWLTAAFRELGLAFPTTGDRMLEVAAAEVAAGGDLSRPADMELGVWLRAWRSKYAAGSTSKLTERLTALDPLWHLNPEERANVSGDVYVRGRTLAADRIWNAGLDRAGWSDTEDAVAWMREIGGSAIAVAVRTGVSVPRATVRIRRVDPAFRVRGEAAGKSIERPLRRLDDHLRTGGSISDLPEETRAWLVEWQSENRHPWVGRLLDELAPNWRSVTADGSAPARR